VLSCWEPLGGSVFGCPCRSVQPNRGRSSRRVDTDPRLICALTIRTRLARGCISAASSKDAFGLWVVSLLFRHNRRVVSPGTGTRVAVSHRAEHDLVDLYAVLPHLNPEGLRACRKRDD
jgi:hypothetical protein